MSTAIRRILCQLITLSLLLPLIGVRTASARKQPQITMTIGRPNIWSLGQAHYLLANMRNTNRGLKVQSPGELNPNSINGVRMEILRTLLGVEAQVSTPQSFQNAVAQQQFQSDFARKQSAITRLDELSREHLRVIGEITELNVALAKLGPQPAADQQVKETELKREELTKERAAKETLRDAIGAQITTATAQANSAVTLSNLQNALPFGTPSPPTMPNLDSAADMKELIGKLISGQPDADASQKLDNYIEMQYEVIAKQLTLLRDEVGPNERLIFLELPASLYTVPQRDDNQMVQIQWKVTDYLEQCDRSAPAEAANPALYVNRRNAEILRNALLAARNWPTSTLAEMLKRALDDADDTPTADLREVISRVIEEARDAATDLRRRGSPRETRQAPPITDEFLARFFELNRKYRNLIVHFAYADAYHTLKVTETKLNSQINRLKAEEEKGAEKTNLGTQKQLKTISDTEYTQRMEQVKYEETRAKENSRQLTDRLADLQQEIAKIETYFKDEEFKLEIAKINKVIAQDPDFLKLFKGNSLENFTNLAPLDQFKRLNELPEIERQNIEELKEMVSWYPQLLWMGWTPTTNSASHPDSVPTSTPTPQTDKKHHANPQFAPAAAQPAAQRQRRVLCYVDAADQQGKVRVIDIVPRRSALNVNDVHATQNGFALAAKFLTLFGFGAQVSYQRQRSLYEQFINEDVFASGFGKGTDNFGWTIGPQPGTKRLAPGPRTTFAILAIPSDAWKISLQASAVAFPRTKSPTNIADKESRLELTPDGQPVSFDLLVPGEDTEGFWADRISYSPVQKGQRVTAIIGGRYFSPLTGVMVDGVPLKRVVAIAKHESDSTTLPLAADSPGEYEYLNPSQIIISFKTSDTNFVGTPLITLVTPEKTGAINFFRDMRINRTYTDSLQRHSLIEPMFLDTFNLASVEIKRDEFVRIPVGSPISIRLRGSGFRRRAQICVNEECVTDPRLRNTSTYEITVRKPAEDVWTITYRLGQDVASKSFSTTVDALRLDAPTIESIENPTTGKPEGLMAGGYTVIVRGANLHHVNLVKFGEAVINGPFSEQHPNVLLLKVPAGTEGAVRVSLNGTVNGQGVSNILDFTTPGKAIFKYLKPPTPPSPAPSPDKPEKKKKKTGKPPKTRR